MGRNVAPDLVIARLGTVAVAPHVGGLVLRLVRKQPAQEPLGAPTASSLVRTL